MRLPPTSLVLAALLGLGHRIALVKLDGVARIASGRFDVKF